MHTCTQSRSIAAAVLLLGVAACGGGGTDTEGGSSGTTLPASTGTTGEPGTGTTEEPTTTATSASTTVEPGTGTTGDTTGTTGASGTTDTGDDTAASTSGAASTGAIEPGPEDIPQIPDDGMPSSARFKKVPLGTSPAPQGYWEYVPAGYGGGEKYPLLVFLHGIGENGDGDGELDKVPAAGVPQLIKNDQWPNDRPFVVLSPQHPGGGCPGALEVHDFLDFALGNYDINPARVYLTGLSCGAIGSWTYLGEYLDQQIVAMVPIAGDGKGAFAKQMCQLGKVPIWAFHGDADDVVNVSGTVEPITGLQMCDPKPEAEMVIYPGVGHNSWSMTYDLSAGHDIYAWLLAHYKQ